MKYDIWKDERYPDYGISPDEISGIELPDSFKERAYEAIKAYQGIQFELEVYYQEYEKRERPWVK